MPGRLHSNVQLAWRLLPAFSNRQLSPTMADSSRTFTEIHFYSAPGEAELRTSAFWHQCRVRLDLHLPTKIWNILFRLARSGRSIYRRIARRKLHKICENGPFPLKSFCATRTISKPKNFALRFAVKPRGGAQLSWLLLQVSATCKRSAVGTVISARRSCLHTTYILMVGKMIMWTGMSFCSNICFCSCCALHLQGM